MHVFSDFSCLSDERCVGGVCKRVCNSDSKCGINQICEKRLCIAGCRSDNVCPDKQACIDKQCRGENNKYITKYSYSVIKFYS